MKAIYIFLTRTSTVLSKLVHFITNDTYTHMSIAFDEDLKTLYTSSRKNGRTLFPAGPCTENLESDYFKKHAKIPCAVYELPVSNETYEKAKREVTGIMNKADAYHFNILGLFLCQLHIPYHRKNYFFCSQFVSEILERSNALTLPKDTSLMKPNDFMYIPELFCRFQGNISDLVSKGKVSFA